MSATTTTIIPPQDSAPARTPGPWLWLARHRETLALPVIFVLALAVFTAASNNFFTLQNLTNVSREAVYLVIASLGQLIVLIAGGLDLAVGSVAALASVVASVVMVQAAQAMPGQPGLVILIGAVVAVALGAFIGWLNGIGVQKLRIPAFMMTLGMSSVVIGLALYVSGGVPIDGLPPELGAWFGYGELLGIPASALVALAFVLIVYVMLEWTRYGRHLYATGGNPRAAALSGIRTERVAIAAYMISGVLAALTGLLLTARLGTGETNVGQSLPLQSIAACVIAGVSLAGGTGRVLWAILGALLITLVQNGLDLMQVGAYAATISIGLILILAMAISSSSSR